MNEKPQITFRYGLNVDTTHSEQRLTEFLANAQQNVVARRLESVVEGGIVTIAEIICGLVDNGRITAVAPRESIIYGSLNNEPLFIGLYSPTRYSEEGEEDSLYTSVNINVYGSPKISKTVLDAIKKALQPAQVSIIKWAHKGSRGTEYKEHYLPPIKTKLMPEFYPDFGDVNKLICDYLKSDASVLLLAGPPGTGKTTMLRHMIQDHNLDAYLVFDEDILKADDLFQTFLFNKKSDLLIIEDADTILGARDREHNKLMSRFLNVSDGLIKLPNKKMVFTTNLTDFNRVDSALIRPGRCFGVFRTRPLSLPEAQDAARVANLPVPLTKGEYTLAELFNQNQKAPPIHRVGFSA